MEHDQGALSDEQKDFVYEHLWRRIESEHSLVSSRMGWLVGANAFLFMPLSIIETRVATLTNVDQLNILVIIICALGVSITIALGLTIVFAVVTLNTLHRRRRSFEEEHLQESEKYKYVNLRKTSPNNNDRYPLRNPNLLKITMWCQIVTPILIFIAWAAVTILVGAR